MANTCSSINIYNQAYDIVDANALHDEDITPLSIAGTNGISAAVDGNSLSIGLDSDFIGETSLDDIAGDYLIARSYGAIDVDLESLVPDIAGNGLAVVDDDTLAVNLTAIAGEGLKVTSDKLTVDAGKVTNSYYNLHHSTLDPSGSVVMGQAADASNDSLAFHCATARNGSIAFKGSAYQGSIALGTSDSNGTNLNCFAYNASIALGMYASASNGSLAIKGLGNENSDNGSSIYYTYADYGGIAIKGGNAQFGSLAFGCKSSATNGSLTFSTTTRFGGSTAKTYAEYGSVVFGQNSSGYTGGYVFGTNSRASNGGYVFGTNSRASNGSIAFSEKAFANNGSMAFREASADTGSFAFGPGTATNGSFAFYGFANAGAVSIGGSVSNSAQYGGKIFGDYSTAWNNGIAIGRYISASNNTIVVGQYNKTHSGAAFVVGNGKLNDNDTATYSDALIVSATGDTSAHDFIAYNGNKLSECSAKMLLPNGAVSDGSKYNITDVACVGHSFTSVTDNVYELMRGYSATVNNNYNHRVAQVLRSLCSSAYNEMLFYNWNNTVKSLKYLEITAANPFATQTTAPSVSFIGNLSGVAASADTIDGKHISLTAAFPSTFNSDTLYFL